MTRKERMLWIIALAQTIHIWIKYRDHNISNSDRVFDCPLCEIARTKVSSWNGTPKFEVETLMSRCNECVHKSKYGMGIICIQQKSYVNAQSIRLNKKAINYRISYLRKIMNKLKTE